jgi:SAM-dependent methyltransferase/uncharacterized protein YbaR (Trm112 family)
VKVHSLEYLVCPVCRSALALEKSISQNGAIMSGIFKCSNKSCKRIFEIKDGFADLCVMEFTEEEAVANSFGFEWAQHALGKWETESVFGRNSSEDLDYFYHATNLTKEDLHGKVILDAGCGSGTLTDLLARQKPQYIFGTDINKSTHVTAHLKSGEENCEIIRADIYHLPFLNETFDIVWSNGVIHHTPDTYQAFKMLCAMVKPGGVLYVWVYEKRFSPFDLLKDLFRATKLDTMDHRSLMLICRIVSMISFVIHSFVRILFYIPVKLGMFKSSSLTRLLRYRSYKTFILTWFDALSPKYDSRHTREEVLEWFRMNNFDDLIVFDYQVGICGKKKR